ncbi:MAG: PEP-CTERM sorting domain-containing protein [Burkholderiales bacterium]|jgi:hypothetical protein|nr:PEP-CTERM sorting domain-containing protein [Burkholderiales bacterium]
MKKHVLTLAVAAITLIPGVGVSGPVSYILRDARFFGGDPATDPSRETTASGAFNSASAESLAAAYSTGGATPTTFNGLASNQGTPFALSVSNHVSAGTPVALNFNSAPYDPTNFVSLVQSRVQESGLLATGASGTGYLIPTFSVTGSFDDTHASASANLGACAGISSCTATGLAFSAGGAQSVDVLFSPAIAANTSFTFGTPFDFFFFVSAGVSAFPAGTLAAGGPVNGDFTMRIAGYKIVDANGNVIPGAMLDSSLFRTVPEPSSLLLLALALATGWALRRRGLA